MKSNKGFNPNPSPGRVYQSIMNQINLLALQAKRDNTKIPVFQTTKKRLETMRQVVFDVAQNYPDIHFQVFGDCTCWISQEIHLAKALCYTWVEQSTQSGKWLVLASPPGALRYDCLSVYKDKDKAVELALEMLPTIRAFDLSEWDKKYNSSKYLELIRSLPFDDDSIVGTITSDGTTMFDRATQDYLQVSLDKASRGEITKEDLQSAVSEFAAGRETS